MSGAAGRSPAAPVDVVVVGAGCIGLSAAWRLAQAGLAVAIVDPRPGEGATAAAAGMLAPVTGTRDAAPPLRHLSLASARRYGAFVGELEDASGISVGYTRCGTLTVADGGGGALVVGELARLAREAGLDAERIGPDGALELEPGLVPGIADALWLPDDHQVDTRRLATALLVACERAGVTVRRRRAVSIEVADGRVRSVLLADSTRLAAATVVVAAGTGTPALDAPPGTLPAIRPVKGEVVHLRGPADQPLVRRAVRRVTAGRVTYVVPRGEGRYTVGATIHEGRHDLGVAAASVTTLLQGARGVLPGIDALDLEGTGAGLRPAAPDGLPVIGPTAVTGLLVATGHFHKGILLAPIAADAVRAAAMDGATPDWAAPFAPGRLSLAGRR